MKISLTSTTPILLGLALNLPGAASAVTNFVEDFGTDAANWRNGASASLPWVSTGGVGGVGDGYVTTTFSFENSASGNTAVMFRGQDGFNSSADAFVGNWIADDVTDFSVWVRHDAPESLNYFTRFASSANFPGGIAVQFIPVAPGAWTKINASISAANPQFVTFEGSSFTGVFSSIGNVQLGIRVPDGLVGDVATYTFDVDRPGVTVVPEPGSIAFALLGTLTLLRRRRR